MGQYTPEWVWEAKARQLNENSKIGDIVDVGYLGENSTHNYQKAEIINIIRSTRYPDGTVDGRKEPFYQVQIRFDDGFECWW